MKLKVHTLRQKINYVVSKSIIVLLAILLTTTFTLQARVPRVSNKSFTYETLELPQMALPENRTYTMSIETAADYGNLACQY